MTQDQRPVWSWEGVVAGAMWGGECRASRTGLRSWRGRPVSLSISVLRAWVPPLLPREGKAMPRGKAGSTLVPSPCGGPRLLSGNGEADPLGMAKIKVTEGMGVSALLRGRAGV